MSRQDRIRDIERRLEEIDQARCALLAELDALRTPAKDEDLPSLLGKTVLAKTPETPEEKIQLFLKLFRARESVFPRLWENASKGT